MIITLQAHHGVPFHAVDNPLWAGAAHGFSTRLGGVSPAPWDSLNLGANRGEPQPLVEENFRRFCTALGTDPHALVKNHQIHGNFIRPVTRADCMPSPAAPGRVEADGLVTNVAGVCLTIFSGDCIPVLLYDPVLRVIAAAHAGWRGTGAGIAQQAVVAMATHYGSSPANILCAIGPGIGPCCFETHADVPTSLVATLGAQAEPFITPSGEAGKFRVDLKALNAHLLQRAGVPQQNIARSSACTACQLDAFWSHRVQGDARGSMAAMIQLV